MKRALVALLLSGVLLTSALDLAVGAVWVAAVVVIFLLGRRVRATPWLVLATTLALGGAGWRWDWFRAPEPASYESGWLGGVPVPQAELKDTRSDESVRREVRARIRAVEETELGLTGMEIERRAATAVRLARTVEAVRTPALREVALVEAAVRRLSLTLTAPEFRDVERRRGEMRAYLQALEARLSEARDDGEARGIARALDPAVMAGVSLRPVREDLERVDRASRALIMALGGGEPTVSALASLAYDEPAGRMIGETRYVLAAGASTRLVGLQAGTLPEGAARQDETRYQIDDGEPVSRPGPAFVRVEDGARRVVVIERWAAPVTAEPVRPRFRWLTVRRISADPGVRLGELTVTVRLDGGRLEIPVAMGLGAPRVEMLVAPRFAIYYVARPGRLSPEAGHDVWRAAPDTQVAGSLVFEARPASVFVRNPLVSWLSAYAARPSPGAALAVVAAAALTVILTRRPRVKAA